MEPFLSLRAVAAPIEGRNIDTDQIIPARFLKADRAGGYGRFLFHDLRFDRDGREHAGFILNRAPFRSARILVTDENFGCGSSREGAAYALHDFGVRAVIAPSFGDIFFNNCLKNGIVPARLATDVAAAVRAALAGCGAPEITIDVEALEVTLPDGSKLPFPLDPFWRECLMKGVDVIDLTRGYMPEIEAFERSYRARRGWTLP